MGKSSDKDKEAGTFMEAVKGARPIYQDRHAPYRRKPRPRPRMREEDDRDVMANLLSDFEANEIESGEELLFQRPGVQNQVMRRLRKGHYAIEGELDLHRRTVDEARTLLSEYLRDARARGKRCVRIIHGKGLGNPDRLPILKGKVNSWLRQWDDVLAFCSAPRTDGGTGAAYVLLRKPGPKR